MEWQLQVALMEKHPCSRFNRACPALLMLGDRCQSRTREIKDKRSSQIWCLNMKKIRIWFCVVCVCVLCAQSSPTLCDPPDWACQAPLSRGFSRQEYWSGLPCPSLWDLLNLGVEPVFSCMAGRFLPLSHLRSPYDFMISNQIIAMLDPYEFTSWSYCLAPNLAFMSQPTCNIPRTCQ